MAVPSIPRAWLDQLADDGMILADVKLNPAAGNLVLVRKHGEVAEGRFDAGQAWFMHMRHPDQPEPPTATRSSDTPTRSTTSLPAVAWQQPVPWFLACLTISSPLDVGYRLDDDYRPVAARLTAGDGSWAEIDTADTEPRAVVQAGPTALWDAIEHAFRTWETNDRPTWDRLGLTITADGNQPVWLDDPDGSTLGNLPTP